MVPRRAWMTGLTPRPRRRCPLTSDTARRPVASWIAHHARRDPGRVALVDLHRGRETTYGDLAARGRAVARGLEERYGVGAGDRVAILSRNDSRVFEVLYACALI